MVSSALSLAAVPATAALVRWNQSACSARRAIGVLVGHFLCGKAMIGIVISYSGLQEAGFEPSDRASAVDEALHHMPHLRGVDIRRDRVAIRQDETDIQVGVPMEVGLENTHVHALIGIFLDQYIQAQIKFRPLITADYGAVTALWQGCDGIEIAERDDETSFRFYLEHNPGLSHCGEADGILIGAAFCGHDGRRGLIYHLTIAPAFRGRGMAREILDRNPAGCGNA